MEGLVTRVRAPQVSFRRPLDLNYQRTFPLPPPTTLIGLAGAALGLADFEIWESHPISNLKVAVFINSPGGLARDMMKVLKVKNHRVEGRSPYFRELLFNTDYTLIYSGEDEILEKLERAFREPAYPLSLGREDELIEVVSINKSKLLRGAPIFMGTAIPGDIRNMDICLPDMEAVVAPLKIEPPIVENVPLKFSIKNGQRIPILKTTLTFLPYSLKIEAREFSGEIFNLDGRNFTWMNS